MRIAIDYTAGIRQGAGVGRFVRNLVGALIKLDHENDYTLTYPRSKGGLPPGLLPVAPNVTGRSLFLSERALNLMWYKLGLPFPIEMLGVSADLFHFPDFALPPVRRGVSVLTVHDLSFLLVPDCAEAGLRAHLERVVPTSVRAADFVTADSENTRNELTTLLDVSPDRVAVVYGGVEGRFHACSDEAILGPTREKYGLTFPFILYVGTIEPRKNLVRLLRAFSELRRQIKTDFRLIIAGGLGWLYQDVLREFDELAVTDAVAFLGRVPDEDLPALYALSDIFVFPSLYEGFGLPPLEAMACGTPVICSNTSSLPEVVGQAGILVSPYDVDGLTSAMADLIRDPDRRSYLGKQGIEQAKQFTWDRSARQLLDIYHRFSP